MFDLFQIARGFSICEELHESCKHLVFLQRFSECVPFRANREGEIRGVTGKAVELAGRPAIKGYQGNHGRPKTSAQSQSNICQFETCVLRWILHVEEHAVGVLDPA